MKETIIEMLVCWIMYLIERDTCLQEEQTKKMVADDREAIPKLEDALDTIATYIELRIAIQGEFKDIEKDSMSAFTKALGL